MSNEGWGENSRIKWGSYSSLDPKHQLDYYALFKIFFEPPQQKKNLKQ
jgi:hypothetical protein